MRKSTCNDGFLKKSTANYQYFSAPTKARGQEVGRVPWETNFESRNTWCIE